MLKKYPLSKCSAKVQAEAAEAERSRFARGGRKRFGGRYTGGFWTADGNGRTPYRPNRFHDSGASSSHCHAAISGPSQGRVGERVGGFYLQGFL